MITKSLAGVAAGVLLIGGGALATAQADPTTTIQVASVQHTASAPAHAVRAGSGYPGSVFTTTKLRVKSPVKRGTVHRARVAVHAGATRTTPKGTVSVSVAGRLRHAKLVNGVAFVRMPQWLHAGRAYTVRATYHPRSGSQWKRSSDTARYRVTH